MNKTHRIGTITLGVTLVIFGSLFLSHLVFPDLSYMFIMKLWPVIFIFLGIEVLVSTFLKSDKFHIVYDKVGIILTGFIIVFSMCAGFLSIVFEAAEKNMHFII